MNACMDVFSRGTRTASCLSDQNAYPAADGSVAPDASVTDVAVAVLRSRLGAPRPAFPIVPSLSTHLSTGSSPHS
jgi:hypothetical protein